MGCVQGSFLISEETQMKICLSILSKKFYFRVKILNNEDYFIKNHSNFFNSNEFFMFEKKRINPHLQYCFRNAANSLKDYYFIDFVLLILLFYA